MKQGRPVKAWTKVRTSVLNSCSWLMRLSTVKGKAQDIRASRSPLKSFLPGCYSKSLASHSGSPPPPALHLGQYPTPFLHSLTPHLLLILGLPLFSVLFHFLSFKLPLYLKVSVNLISLWSPWTFRCLFLSKFNIVAYIIFHDNYLFMNLSSLFIGVPQERENFVLYKLKSLVPDT